MASDEEDGDMEGSLAHVEELVSSEAFREFVHTVERRPPNVFRIAGISTREVYLSKVVAWLLSPWESHHLGDQPLRSLLLLAAKARTDHADTSHVSVADVYAADLSDCQVVTERRTDNGRRIDILVECRAAKLVVAIENKVWAQEHGDQLPDYADWVRKRYLTDDDSRSSTDDEWSPTYVFLTPYGHHPSDTQFVPVSYTEWIPQLKQMAPPGGGTGVVVTQFVTNMEEILDMAEGSGELDKLRQALWQKHREAMEVLTAWSPTDEQLSTAIHDRLQKGYKDVLRDLEMEKKAGWVNLRFAKSVYIGAWKPGYCISVGWHKIGCIVGLFVQNDDLSDREAAETASPTLEGLVEGKKTLHVVKDGESPGRKGSWICYLEPSTLHEVLRADGWDDTQYRLDHWDDIVEKAAEAVVDLSRILPPAEVWAKLPKGDAEGSVMD